MTRHNTLFLRAVEKAGSGLDKKKLEELVEQLSHLKGRLFILGVGGSAANASHAVNDMRKLCGIDAHAPTDNIAEITARTNDDGFDRIFVDWLLVSRLCNKDALLILSVGGGTPESSRCLIEAIKLAKENGAKVYGIVGKDDGATAKHADIAIVVPVIEKKWITPVSEAMQMVILHCLVSSPALQKNKTKW